MNPIRDENTLFIATPVLPYRQQRTGPSPLHCTEWYLVSHWLGKCRSTDQAGDDM